jgi:hypothetical protein
MPNWVYNSVYISGEAGEVERIVARLSTPNDINGEMVSQPFSFWNIVKPTNLDAYFDTIGTGGRSMDDPDGWYEWNCKNWGCKWDAKCDEETVEVDYLKDQTACVNYHFDTAWSHPEAIIKWLTKYCREHELSLDWHYEEEQGWGGEVLVDSVGKVTIKEWDIPSSHADNRGLGRDCVCEYDDAEEYWFDDCPLMSDEEKTRRAKEVV